ncbi:Holliday junction resolvase, partial [Candidatus Bathyarchaeota archaeon]
VLRAPSSGSRTKLDRPDILAGRKGLCLAIEVKSTSKETFYMKEETVNQLVRFSEKFGAKPFVAVKFKHKKLDWILVEPENLIKTVKGYKITLKQAKVKGKSLEAILTKSLGEYL